MTSILVDLGLSAKIAKIAKICIQQKYPAIQVCGKSWVEIKHYSIAYFDRITAFEVL